MIAKIESDLGLLMKPTKEIFAFFGAFADLRKSRTADEALHLLIVLSASLISSSENPDKVLDEQIELLRKQVPEMVAKLPQTLEEIARARKVLKSERRTNKGLKEIQ